jgi:hypothetical protein
VLLSRGDVTDGTLPKDSMVRLGKIFTLHSSLVVKRLCRLTPEKKNFLMTQLQAFLGG